MSEKTTEAGRAFLSSVLAKLSPELREQAEKVFAAPEAADALDVIGTGALAQPEINRRLNEIREKEETLTTDFDRLNGWYDTNKERLGKVETLEAEIARLSGTPPPKKDEPVAKIGLTREELDKEWEIRERNAATFFNTTNLMAIKHLRLFNEELDLNELTDYALKNRLPLDRAYQQKFAEPLAKKAKEAEDLRIGKLVDERLTEERKKYTDHPFPLRNQTPAALDILESKEHKPSDHTVDTALAEYERLQAARG